MNESDLEDLKQHITILLYSAYDEGNKNTLSSQFDTWVEERVNEIGEYFLNNKN